ncbi:MAG: prepilin-type N-terminal cleavage/methylation domain-containing protein [Candidatus Omnitrophica bacterium]|nr:prepilin-type N-terminal cleavage/methylation domain-containing protein [Candidatus Omnitrophota bacterium]
MMMSITGNRRSFTLIEVMVATVILAVSTVWISQSFFMALNSYNYCARYLGVVAWANDKIWEAQDNLRQSGPLAVMGDSGEFTQEKKNVAWSLAYAPVGENNLYKIDLELSWKEGPRNSKLQRSAYAVYYAQE